MFLKVYHNVNINPVWIEKSTKENFLEFFERALNIKERL